MVRVGTVETLICAGKSGAANGLLGIFFCSLRPTAYYGGTAFVRGWSVVHNTIA